MSVTTVRLQPELEEHLGAMAEKLHRSKSWVINQSLREFFERQELEQTRWQETLQAMAPQRRPHTKHLIGGPCA